MNKLLEDLSMSFVSLAWYPPCLVVLHHSCSVWKWCFCRKRFWQLSMFGSTPWHMQNWFRIAVCDQALGAAQLPPAWWAGDAQKTMTQVLHKCSHRNPEGNEGKQHMRDSWGQMAVLHFWDNVRMGDKICSDGNSWYVIRITLLDSHYATKRQF